jgi:hypothetical protein
MVGDGLPILIGVGALALVEIAFFIATGKWNPWVLVLDEDPGHPRASTRVPRGQVLLRPRIRTETGTDLDTRPYDELPDFALLPFRFRPDWPADAGFRLLTAVLGEGPLVVAAPVDLGRPRLGARVPVSSSRRCLPQRSLSMLLPPARMVTVSVAACPQASHTSTSCSAIAPPFAVARSLAVFQCAVGEHLEVWRRPVRTHTWRRPRTACLNATNLYCSTSCPFTFRLIPSRQPSLEKRLESSHVLIYSIRLGELVQIYVHISDHLTRLDCFGPRAQKPQWPLVFAPDIPKRDSRFLRVPMPRVSGRLRGQAHGDYSPSADDRNRLGPTIRVRFGGRHDAPGHWGRRTLGRRL